MGIPPAEALALSPRRWTDEEIRETYERVCKEPLYYRQLLPPKLERRHIVVGGSGEHCLLLLFFLSYIHHVRTGLVGGNVVLHLLLRG